MILTFADEAKADLRRLVDFVTPKNPDAAINIGDRLIDACQTLADMPFKGRPSLQEESARELIVGPYVILYRVRDPLVEILHIYHGAEDWKNK